MFSHEYWKAQWGIPTLAERKATVAARDGGKEAAEATAKRGGGKKRKKAALPVSGGF